jgi:hypothetical protein
VGVFHVATLNNMELDNEQHIFIFILHSAYWCVTFLYLQTLCVADLQPSTLWNHIHGPFLAYLVHVLTVSNIIRLAHKHKHVNFLEFSVPNVGTASVLFSVKCRR